ncbi:hypothetical protein MKW92_027585 [Papaver armeniacum]|nr:hypothetical protein MKW92_027585 [Papaver armeniacum]
MEGAGRDVNVQFNDANIVTTVTNDPFKVECALMELRASLATSQIGRVVGLDIKHKSNDNERAATLQLCHENRCLVIQLLYLDSIPKSLRSFLADSSIRFLGVNIKQDTGKLDRYYGLKCNNSIDLGSRIDDICECYKYSDLQLSELAAEILGVVIVKPPSVARSDWGATLLSSEQVKYATIDAYASFAIIKKLSSTEGNFSEAMGYYRDMEEEYEERRMRAIDRSMGLP